MTKLSNSVARRLMLLVLAELLGVDSAMAAIISRNSVNF
jgi:hypothetical protein